MNDQLNESISALVDGEADDLELRRLLNQLKNAAPEEAQALRARWASYHQLGSALRGETAAASVDPEFSAGVAAAIAQLDSDATGHSSPVEQAAPGADYAQQDAALVAVPAWKRLAVAASVTLAVLVGYQQLAVDSSSPGPAVAVVEEPAGSLAAELEQVALSSGAQAASAEQAAMAQQRLNEYLLRHTSHAAQQSGQGMIPFARLANFEEE